MRKEMFLSFQNLVEEDFRKLEEMERERTER